MVLPSQHSPLRCTTEDGLSSWLICFGWWTANNQCFLVFLRVLEYFDGILILTSNRVGTIDEGFKSRIQLSLHYENLNEAQRKQVWEHFFKRLDIVAEDTVDTENLRRNIKELAMQEMNGRQIRNTVTTARQLARHHGEVMCYRHLKQAVKVSGKSDRYLKQLKHGVSHDDVMREEGVR